MSKTTTITHTQQQRQLAGNSNSMAGGDSAGGDSADKPKIKLGRGKVQVRATLRHFRAPRYREGEPTVGTKRVDADGNEKRVRTTVISKRRQRFAQTHGAIGTSVSRARTITAMRAAVAARRALVDSFAGELPLVEKLDDGGHVMQVTNESLPHFQHQAVTRMQFYKDAVAATLFHDVAELHRHLEARKRANVDQDPAAVDAGGYVARGADFHYVWETRKAAANRW